MGLISRQTGVILVAMLAGGLVVAGATFLLRRPYVPAEMPREAAAGAHADLSDQLPADWCAPQFEPIPGGGCLAALREGGPAQSLIVYLHGRYARHAAVEEIDRQSRLAERATARGFAVLALRGGLGACSAPELADWFCWPNGDPNADAAIAVVQTWAEPIARAHQLTGARARYLLGFSNGGYFAGLVAARGLVEVDALVVAHGGPVEPVRALRSKPPVLLLSADDDVAQDDMIRFDALLVRERWAHDAYARPGAHGLTDGDIDSALTFFLRSREPLPLDPPLPMHRAISHVRRANAASPSTEPSTAATESTDSSEEPAGRSRDDPGQVDDGSFL